MADNKNILVIGAGNIGVAITNLIPSSGYNITLSDCNTSSLNNPLIQPRTATIELDVTDKKALHNALKDQDYVINAGPYYITSTIAKAAVDTETHYFDLTEDVTETEIIKKLANDTLKTALVPQCGLAPGYISIAANQLAIEFDEVHDIKMRVGALPRYPTNELRYNMTWSIDGLINEYLQDCYAIENGRLIQAKSLEGYETFVLDSNRYEAFNTSGGLGTLCETWGNKVHSLNYKTVRYPGHHYLIKFLIDEMKLGEAELKKMFNTAIPTTNQDVVLIFIEVSGFINDRLTTRTLNKKIYSRDPLSAIQLTTASGVCGMVEAHKQGKIPYSGFIKQEQLSLTDFSTIDTYRLKGIYNT